MDLPNELIIEISSYLIVNDIFNNRLICKDWYSVTNDDVLWSKLMKRDFNKSKPNQNKEFYISTYNYLSSELTIKCDIKKYTSIDIDDIKNYGFVQRNNKWIFCPSVDDLKQAYKPDNKWLIAVEDKKTYDILNKLLPSCFKRYDNMFYVKYEDIKIIYDFIHGNGSFDKALTIRNNEFSKALKDASNIFG